MEEVEEEMDSLMKEMFGSKLEEEVDIGMSTESCEAEGLDQVQDGLRGRRKKQPKEAKKGGGALLSTAGFKEVKATACKEELGMMRELQRRNCSRNKGA